MSWRSSVFHVYTLTYGVYEMGKNPVNHGLACCLSVEFYVYVLGSHIGEKGKELWTVDQEDNWNHWNEEKIRQR